MLSKLGRKGNESSFTADKKDAAFAHATAAFCCRLETFYPGFVFVDRMFRLLEQMTYFFFFFFASAGDVREPTRCFSSLMNSETSANSR